MKQLATRRDAGIEVLRCILMAMIVLGHSIGHGPYAGAGHGFAGIFPIVFAWHVNAFVAISGWYGIRFSWRKIVRVVGLFAFYSVLSMVYVLLTHVDRLHVSDFAIKGGWFGACYVALMCCAPIINTAVDSLRQEPLPVILGVWIPLAAAFTYNWLPYGLVIDIHAAGVGSFMLTQLLFVYTTARLVRIVHERIDLSKYAKKTIVLYAIICVGAWALSDFVPPVRKLVWKFFTYDCPAVWLMAFSVVILFARMKFDNWIGRLCVYLAPSMFAVYLFQDTTSFRWLFYLTLEQRVGQSCGPWAAIACAAIATFILAVSCDIVRRKLVGTLVTDSHA